MRVETAEGEILLNISGNMTWEISGEILPKTGVNTEERSLNANQEVKISAKPAKNTEEIKEQKKYYSEEAEVQNMSIPNTQL